MYYNELQKEQREWQRRNFGDQPAHRCILGVVEELGELIEAHSRSNREGVKDAAGDTIIYLAGVATAYDIDLQAAIAQAVIRLPRTSDGSGVSVVTSDNLNGCYFSLGKIAHAALKLEQGIRTDEAHRERMMEAIGDLWAYLGTFLASLKLSLTTDCVQPTWYAVVRRDWKADPVKGAAA